MATEQTPTTIPILERDLFMNNKWLPSSSGEILTLLNPATEEPFGRAASATKEDVDAAVEAARAAFDPGHGRGFP